MGGAGGGFNSTRQDIRSVQDATRDTAYEAECNAFLRELLVGFNDRNVEAVRTHVEEIETALGKEVSGSINLAFGGSITKHTYVDGISDVDALVILDNCELSEATPAEAKLYLVSRLQERFPRTEITEGQLAVTAHFSDIDVQLLPAVTCNGTTHISDETINRWAPIRPKEFANILSRVNADHSSKVVPVVKIAKAIVSNLPEQQRTSGYHMESLAVDVFRNYDGAHTLKDMTKHFFTEAARRVLAPIRDTTGQSVHVDDALGDENSVERRRVGDAFARVARRMGNADAAATLEGWKGILGVN